MGYLIGYMRIQSGAASLCGS